MSETEASSDEIFFFSNVADYLDDELSPADLDRFTKLLEKEEYKDAPEVFSKQRGILQIQLQSFGLDQEQHLSLQSKLSDKEASQNMEASKIKEISNFIHLNEKVRYLTIATGVLLLLYAVYYIFSPSPQATFDVLEAVGYEAVALDEDTTNSRLSLPSSDLIEISQLLSAPSKFQFSPVVWNLPEPWVAEGVSTIDYEITTLAVVKYQRNEEDKIFLFSLPGDIKNLPESTPEKIGNTEFQAYASDQINMIVWQEDKNTLGILSSRLGIKDLIEIAKSR